MLLQYKHFNQDRLFIILPKSSCLKNWNTYRYYNNKSMNHVKVYFQLKLMYDSIRIWKFILKINILKTKQNNNPY